MRRVKFSLALNLLGLCDKFHILYVTTKIYLVSENIPFSTTTLLITLILAFFLQKQYLYSKQQYEKLCQRFLSSVFIFIIQIQYIYNTNIIYQRCRVFLVKFSNWSNFYVNIMISSGVVIIFVYKRFEQKSGNWKYPRLRCVQYLKIEMSQGYQISLYLFN